MKAKGKLQICLKGLEIMNDDPTQVDVMYAKCEAVDGTNASTVQQIADAIAHKFAEKGLLNIHEIDICHVCKDNDLIPFWY